MAAVAEAAAAADRDSPVPAPAVAADDAGRAALVGVEGMGAGSTIEDANPKGAEGRTGGCEGACSSSSLARRISHSAYSPPKNVSGCQHRPEKPVDGSRMRITKGVQRKSSHRRGYLLRVGVLKQLCPQPVQLRRRVQLNRHIAVSHRGQHVSRRLLRDGPMSENIRLLSHAKIRHKDES